MTATPAEFKSTAAVDLERKTVEVVDCKMVAEGSGGLTGYASVFGNLDRAGEVVVKGAFKATLPAFLKDGFVALNHDWSEAPIGYVTEAKEDDKGLAVAITFHSTAKAQAVRQILQERMAAGKSVAMSIGYRVKVDEMSDAGRMLKELDLMECSIVNCPANPKALVASVKGADLDTPPAPPEAKGAFEDEIAESLRDPYTLTSTLMRVWYDACSALRRRDTTVDPVALITEAGGEFLTRLIAAIQYRVDNPEEQAPSGYYYDSAPMEGVAFKQRIAVELAEAGAALEFGEDSRAVGAAVAEVTKGVVQLETILDRYAPRFKWQLERRAKESRTISTSTATTLTEAHSLMETAEGALASAKDCVASLMEMSKPKKGTEPGTAAPPEVEPPEVKTDSPPPSASSLYAEFLQITARQQGVAV